MNENKELLTEDEFKIMIAGFLTVFLFSEDWDNKGIKKLTPELKDKIESIFNKVNLYDWLALSNIPSDTVLIENDDEVVSMALKSYKKSILGYSALYVDSLAHAHNKVKALTKVFELGAELLVNSSLIADGTMTKYEKLRDKTEIEVLGSIIDQDKRTQRWVKGVANLFLSKVFSFWVVFHAKEGGMHDHIHELLSLIRKRFKSNKIIYQMAFKGTEFFYDTDEETAAAEKEGGIAATVLDSFISVEKDLSLETYISINKHFDESFGKLFSESSSIKEIFDLLLREYGLSLNFPDNKIFLNHSELLQFKSFESKSNIDNDFLNFLRKDKKRFAGIKEEDFALAQGPSSEESSESKAKIDKDGFELIDPKKPGLGVVKKVDFDDLWREVNLEWVRPIEGKYLNEEKELIFYANEVESMEVYLQAMNFAADKLKELQEKMGEEQSSIQLTKSEVTIFDQGRVFLENMPKDYMEDARLLKMTNELEYSLSCSATSEILFWLKSRENVEEVAAYKYSSDLFSIDEDLYSIIIKVFVIKNIGGNCEILAMPFFRS